MLDLASSVLAAQLPQAALHPRAAADTGLLANMANISPQYAQLQCGSFVTPSATASVVSHEINMASHGFNMASSVTAADSVMRKNEPVLSMQSTTGCEMGEKKADKIDGEICCIWVIAMVYTVSY